MHQTDEDFLLRTLITFVTPILTFMTTTLIQSDHVNSVWPVSTLNSRPELQVQRLLCSECSLPAMANQRPL